MIFLVLLCGSITPVWALDPAKPPGQNFDLSHWYLGTPATPSSTSIPAADLTAGYTNVWFFTGPDGAMVFWCPVTGGTTSGSSYPRSELREQIAPPDNTVNWSAQGTHILDAQCKVTVLPSSGKVIIGQIHSYSGAARPLLKLVFDNGSIDAQVKHSPNSDTDDHVSFSNVPFNTLITYRIRFSDGLLAMTINGVTRTVDVYGNDQEWANQTFYFKAGSYCQDTSGGDTEGARVEFYSLAASHSGILENPPVITAQPVSRVVTQGASVSFSLMATGSPQLVYQWLKDGLELPGATSNLLALVGVKTSDAGDYTAVVTNAFGSVTSTVAALTVFVPPPVIPLAEALDTTNLVWTTNGNPPWSGQTNVTHDGTNAARSGAIGDGTSTSIKTTVTGPGAVSFWWKVSSEPVNDTLRFYVNGSEQARISGETNWVERTFELGSGSQAFEWRYSKNSSKTGGLDTAWVDQVRFGSSPPRITFQPFSQNVDAGTTVTFNITAAGTPPLSYRWWFEGTSLSDGPGVRGATNATLTLSNVPLARAGNYWVVVSNAASTVASSNAILVVNPIVTLAEALDTPALVWTTSGTPPWVGQTNLMHDGVDAARSGAIGDGKTTTMQTIVQGPGTVSFWWKVDSEPSNDRLLFYVGSSEKARITGNVDWQWRTFTISSGSQTLKWTYSKNSSKTGGVDSAWADQVLYIPANVPTASIIAVHPLSQNVEAGTAVTFSVGAVGSTPLSYFWLRDGTVLTNGNGVSGATTATLTLASAQPAQAGTYSVLVSNAVDVLVSSNALFTVAPQVPLAEALDAPALVWTTSGTPPWVGQTNVTHDPEDAARSGAIADGKTTTLQTTVQGPGTLSFWWKVSCETNNDRLRFYVDGSEQARISGEVNWEPRTFNISPGSQVLEWRYVKNSSVTAGLDRGWVDQVTFTPDGIPVPAPFLELSRPLAPRLTVAGTEVLLTWDTAPGKTYRVSFKENFSDADWIVLAGSVEGTDSTASVADNVEGPSQRFYQVTEE
jgi:uncharacterized lipoprotein YmbA